jgi:hypothetical protein
MPGKPKPTAKRASRASGPRKPAAKAKKTAKAGTKAKSPPKAGAKAKPGASEAKPMTGKAVSRLIDQRIRDLGGWRGETLARMRALILEADPEMIEEWKWRGTPVWSHHGIVCTGEAYTKVVKLTFARGRASQTHRGSSIPAWTATREGRSISTKGRRSALARSRRS